MVGGVPLPLPMGGGGGGEAKKAKRFDEVSAVSIPEPGQPSPGQLTTDKVRLVWPVKLHVNFPSNPT